MRRNNHSITIDRVHDHEIDLLLNLYVDLFHDREPLTKCVGLSRERMILIARSMHTGSKTNPLSQGLCWIARDHAEANKAVGFIVCDDPAAEGNQQFPENLTDQEREKISTMMVLLEEIRKPGKERIASGARKCLHIAAVGVTPGYEGAGIATSLLQMALADATARGFTHVFSECTSIASRKCHEKAGFMNLHCVAVNEFAVNGVCPFSGSNMDIYLLWKDLAKRAC
jgi:ribosomal protein S18 acetylase RimI-like enzyme